jgi:drug/metabolite transporter (DMT)-like permease
MFAYILVAICIVFGAVGQILMKHGMTLVGNIQSGSKLFSISTVTQIGTNPFVIGGLFLYAMAFFLWLGALSNLDVSKMYPLLSIGYIVTAILSFSFLGEHISLLRIGGILVIMIGCFMLLRS